MNGQIGITELCPQVENLEAENSHFADRAPAARVSAARFKKKLTRRRSGGVEAERFPRFVEGFTLMHSVKPGEAGAYFPRQLEGTWFLFWRAPQSVGYAASLAGVSQGDAENAQLSTQVCSLCCLSHRDPPLVYTDGFGSARRTHRFSVSCTMCPA